MSIQRWSDDVLVVDLEDPPGFSEDIQALNDRLDHDAVAHVVLNFSAVTRMNSSNISQLLKLRKRLSSGGRRLKLCTLANGVWGMILTIGLDKQFDFQPDVTSALATLQMGDG